MRTEQETEHAVDKYTDMIHRICFYHLKNRSDTEDICQNVFLKYLVSDLVFQSEEHEKAWFVRVTLNECKDRIKYLVRHFTTPLELIEEEAVYLDEEKSEILCSVLSLPLKYRSVIYLFYYEGYSALEISSIIKKKENTVYSLLHRGREMLREMLGGEVYG